MVCLERKGEESQKEVLGRMEEEIEQILDCGKDASVKVGEEQYQLRAESREDAELDDPLLGLVVQVG